MKPKISHKLCGFFLHLIILRNVYNLYVVNQTRNFSYSAQKHLTWTRFWLAVVCSWMRAVTIDSTTKISNRTQPFLSCRMCILWHACHSIYETFSTAWMKNWIFPSILLGVFCGSYPTAFSKYTHTHLTNSIDEIGTQYTSKYCVKIGFLFSLDSIMIRRILRYLENVLTCQE